MMEFIKIFANKNIITMQMQLPKEMEEDISHWLGMLRHMFHLAGLSDFVEFIQD